MRTHFDVSREIAATPSAAWTLLVDTRSWAAWGPSVAEARSDPPVLRAAGQRGAARAVVGPWVPFTVTDFVPGARWSWRVAGIAATGHRVEPMPTGCRIVFEVPIVVAPYVVVCRVALGRLASLLEGPRS